MSVSKIINGIFRPWLGLDRLGNLTLGTHLINYNDQAGVPGTFDLTTGGGGGTNSVAFASSVSDAAPGATQNNYSPAGYTGGTTNRLKVTANAGGTALTGLSSTGVTDGWTVYLRNTSATDSITLDHQNAGSIAANRFSLPNGANFVIPPLSGALLTYDVNQWEVIP